MASITKINSTDGQRRLQGKVALVTGGSRGIGKAIAEKLASLGAAVSICARNAERLQQVREELRTRGERSASFVADVTQSGDVEKLVRETEEQLGPIDILVNNAGIGMFGPVHEKSEEDWDRAMNTNLKSVFLMSRAVAPGMIARKSGEIVNISSLAGKNTFAGGGIYCTSKWGLMGLSRCMAEDLRVHGIRVTTICPGSVATEFAGRGPKDVEKVLSAEDVAHAVGMVLLEGPKSFISEVDVRPLGRG